MVKSETRTDFGILPVGGNADPVFMRHDVKGNDMAMTHDLTTLRNQAKNLRKALAAMGTEIGHSQSLELVAKSHGARDWNTMHAAASQPGWQFGGRVSGRYLGQPFTGRIVAAREQGRGHHAVTVDFDKPVDVSRSALFSALRKRVNATITPEGRSLTKTSDGQPHLVLAA